MIILSNRHRLEWLIASGGLAFDGRGWLWERLLCRLGLIKPHLFTIVTKTLFLEPWKGNFQKLAPWKTVKLISGEGRVINPFLGLMRPHLIKGVVNAVGLTNRGLKHWLQKDYPVILFNGCRVIVSISGPGGQGCVEMARRLNGLDNIAGIEFNASCPNTDPALLENADLIVEICHNLKNVSRLPLLLKLSCVQPYVEIARRTASVVDAISINSVPWSVVFPNKKSPLARYGGGGVSGKVIQPFTWGMVYNLVKETEVPVIGPSVWEYEDIGDLYRFGASAVHFGGVSVPFPWRPTRYVEKWRKEHSESC
ncbi:MAG: hypothetical protein ABIG08_00885 [bacterium]